MVFKILILIVGIVWWIYSMIEAYRDSDALIMHPRSQFYVSILWRKGTRIFIFILGLVMVLLGFYILFTGNW